MKIILHVEVETDEDAVDAAVYVSSLKGVIRRRQGQDMPGVMLEHGDGSIWVKDVEIVLEEETC